MSNELAIESIELGERIGSSQEKSERFINFPD